MGNQWLAGFAIGFSFIPVALLIFGGLYGLNRFTNDRRNKEK